MVEFFQTARNCMFCRLLQTALTDGQTCCRFSRMSWSYYKIRITMNETNLYSACSTNNFQWVSDHEDGHHHQLITYHSIILLTHSSHVGGDCSGYWSTAALQHASQHLAQVVHITTFSLTFYLFQIISALDSKIQRAGWSFQSKIMLKSSTQVMFKQMQTKFVGKPLLWFPQNLIKTPTLI